MSGAIVVVWTGYRAGPWAIRSLKASGWKVTGLHPDDEGRGRSTACLRPRPCPSVESATDAFVESVVTACREVGARAVLPLGEECTRIMAEEAPDLGETHLAGPDAAQYAALCDKRSLAENAAAAGVGHPNGIVVNAEGRSGDWPALPSFVKTTDGVAPDRGTAATRVDTVAARDRAVAELVDAGLDAVVEELIVATQWTVHCVRWGDGGFAGVAAKVVRNYPRGAGSPTVSVSGEPGHPTFDATRRLLDAIDYRGAANAQFFVRGDEILVHDVNLRLPASVALAMGAGLDVPALGVSAALGAPFPDLPEPRGGVGYISVGDEIRAMGRANGGNPGRREIARDLARGALSRGTMLDPPLRDPLWIGADLIAGARRTAARARHRTSR